LPPKPLPRRLRRRYNLIERICYFALIALLAIAVLYPNLFGTSFQSVSLSGVYFALLIVVVGVLAYAIFEGRSIILTRGEDGKVSINGTRFDDGKFASTLTVVIVVGLTVYGYSVLHSMFLTAILVGAIGGLVHEIAQSQGKYVLPSYDQKEFYLGSLFGLIAGGVAGLIFVAQGIPQVGSQTGNLPSNALIAESFLAGLGLKGFADAVNPPKPKTG
jgi:hypothetical protein